jgi:hypothetical protein
MGPIAKLRFVLALSKLGDIDMLKNLFSTGALKSKTVWMGVLQLLMPILSVYLNGGVLTLEELLPVITGIGTILGRASATQPLAAK